MIRAMRHAPPSASWSGFSRSAAIRSSADSEEQAAHVAVDHPDVVDRYRHGHACSRASTALRAPRLMRKAMIDFRAVIDELLEGERTAAA